jgi:predicted dehydrogenase
MSNRILIIGFGSIARKHIAAVKQLDCDAHIKLLRRNITDVELPGLCTQVNNIADALKWSPSHAIICTPTSMHLDHIWALVQANIKILVEKPVCDPSARSLHTLEQIIPLQHTIYVAYPYRFHPIFDLVHSSLVTDRKSCWIVDRGFDLQKWQVGPWPYKDSYAARSEMGGGALLTLCHELDLFVSLLGIPDKVYGHYVNTNLSGIDADDLATYTLQWGSLVSASFRVDMLRKSNFLSIIGISTEKNLGIYFDSDMSKSLCAETDSQSRQELETHHFSFSTFGNLYLEQVRDFLDDDSTRLCTLKQGVDSLKVLLRIKQLAEKS